ncbi:MAG: lipid II flippase MurJ [Thermincolia bacterium]
MVKQVNLRSVLSLGILAGANIFVVFLYQWYVLTTIGPGMETDALFAGMALPQLVLVVISGSLMHVLVPLLAGEEEERFSQDAWGFFILVGGVFGAFAYLLYLLAPFWVPVLVPGFSNAGKALVVNLTRIQLIGMVFTALSGVLWAVYHARQRFLWAELTTLLGTIVGLVLLMWALPRYGIRAAAWISVVSGAIQTLLLLPGLGRYTRPEWGSASLVQAWRRIKPLLIGTVYYKTDPLVDRFLSSMAPAGGLTLLYLGQQIYGAVTQIINKAIAAPMVPLLASYAKADNWSVFRQVYRKRLWWVTGLTCGGYLLFLLVGKPTLKLLVGHGGVTEQNVLLLWWIMVALIGVFVGGAMGQILSAAFYAKGSTVTPTRIGAMGFTLGIVLKVTGFYLFGLIGIAIGTTLYYMLNVLVLYIFLERELHDLIPL